MVDRALTRRVKSNTNIKIKRPPVAGGRARKEDRIIRSLLLVVLKATRKVQAIVHPARALIQNLPASFGY